MLTLFKIKIKATIAHLKSTYQQIFMHTHNGFCFKDMAHTTYNTYIENVKVGWYSWIVPTENTTFLIRGCLGRTMDLSNNNNNYCYNTTTIFIKQEVQFQWQSSTVPTAGLSVWKNRHSFTRTHTHMHAYV